MKVAVATNNYKNVVGHVGRCKGFIIYDVENGEIKERKEIENPFSKQKHEEKAEYGRGHSGAHGHGGRHGHHHNHDDLAKALDDTEVLLCKQAGPGLIISLNQRGIKVFFTNERFGDDAVLKLDNNELEYIDPMEIM